MDSTNQPWWSSPWQWGGFVLPTLLTVILLLSPVGRALELFSFDLLYLFRPKADLSKLTEVVILKMDEESHTVLRQNPNLPWDRKVHARVLRELTARGAKVVAFDVLFAEPASDAKADEELSAAIREQGRVVLAEDVKSSREVGSPPLMRLIPPIDILDSNAVAGVVEVLDGGLSSSEIIRLPQKSSDYTNFSWQAAALFGGAPREHAAARWLNYYGPAGTLPAVSYHRVLETNSLPVDYFAGKAVFIGRSGVITSSGTDSDLHATPFSLLFGGRTSGVELQATAFLNLIHREWLEKTTRSIEILLFLAFGCVLAFLLQSLAPWKGALLALVATFLVASTAHVVTWQFHIWFPWLLIAAVQIPLVFFWFLLLHTRRMAVEREELEREVALAESMAGFVVAPKDTLPTQSAREPGSEGLPPIPNHRLIRRIGRGSYGEVWIAQDEIGSHHAVKIVYQRSFASASPYEREFRGIQKFTPISRGHPGFVNILHVGRNDPEGYFFYIMELGDDKLTGQQIDPVKYSPNTLAIQLEAGRLPPTTCVQLGLDLTAALQHLHQHQLVHRDIKPSNIIYVNGNPKFADVGLVTDIAAKGEDASLVGTEGYLAPEGPGTPAADVYSLGKMLYEACTGRDRYEFPSLSSTLIASGDTQLRQLNEVILKACQHDKNQRYQDAAEMHYALLRVKQELGN